LDQYGIHRTDECGWAGDWRRSDSSFAEDEAGVAGSHHGSVIGAFAVLARHHTLGSYATETDFYQLYGPDAERIGAWTLPENDNKAPGYPALVALVSLATGDVFVAGKWISVVSAALAGLLVFLLCARLFGYWAGVGAQLLLLVSGPFPRFALSAATDVGFLLLCLATLLCFMTDRPRARWRVAVAGAATGAACLVRLNGIFLTVRNAIALNRSGKLAHRRRRIVHFNNTRTFGFICGGHRAVALENLALRQQVAVLRRTVKRPRLRTRDRLFCVLRRCGITPRPARRQSVAPTASLSHHART
jgi:cell division protein FtsW (lipid II flippase)